MLFSIMCIDRPEVLDLRLSVRPKHLDWLQKNLPSQSVFVGPLLDDEGKTFRGSLYILDFECVSKAREWISNEPYNMVGLFESIIIRSTRNILPLK